LLSVKKYGDVLVAGGTLSFFRKEIKAYLYLVDGVLIDTGPRNLGKEVMPFLQDQKIERVILTHLHEDHVSLGSWLAATKQVPVYIHPISVPLTGMVPRIRLYRRYAWGNYAPFASQPLESVVETGKYRLEVIPCPGHTEDHVVFYERRKGWLFSGDLYLHPRRVLYNTQESVKQELESLKRVLQLDFDTIFCAHAGPRKNGKRLLAEKLNNIEAMVEEVRELAKRGWEPRRINRFLFPKTALDTYISLGESSTYNLVRSIYDEVLPPER
jgi:glyoxylase-like metal-dependent hydrolase (beta-lactamase superfamily II)